MTKGLPEDSNGAVFLDDKGDSFGAHTSNTEQLFGKTFSGGLKGGFGVEESKRLVGDENSLSGVFYAKVAL